MREKNKSYSSSRDKNADKESEQVKTAQKEKETKKSFSYNNDNCEQTEKRSRGRPPLREQKNENSVVNDFSLSFILDSMLLM